MNPLLTKASGATFYNSSPVDLKAIVGDQDKIAINLAAYLHSFSPNLKDIFARLKLEAQIDRLANADLLLTFRQVRLRSQCRYRRQPGGGPLPGNNTQRSAGH